MPFICNAFSWIQQNTIEILAVSSGLIYVYYTIKEKNILWFFGIISSALFVWIFIDSRIYAYGLLYVYYVLIGIYGWYNWAKGSSDKEPLKVQKASGRFLFGCIAATILIAIPVFFILKAFTDSDMAFLDALLTAGGMVATWMLTQKILDQWLFWIVIDLLSFGVMIYKDLFPSALLFLVYTLLAIKGYFEWKKELSHS
jgi:nicotinamide mononucleotide transporter